MPVKVRKRNAGGRLSGLGTSESTRWAVTSLAANTFTFGDLFSGGGGMSYGFVAHPSFAPTFAVDRQVGKPSGGVGSLECNTTYAANIGIEPFDRDLFKYGPEDLMSEAGVGRGSLDVLIACAPCTGFSRAVNANHLRDDRRNGLVGRVGDFVEAMRPRVLVMENARELVNGNFRDHLDGLLRRLNDLGYDAEASVHVLSKFGLPQVRERALLLACEHGLTLRTLDDLWSNHRVAREATTVRRAIGGLPVVEAGTPHSNDPAHVSPGMGELNRERLRAIPRDGGSWRHLIGHPDAERLMTPAMIRHAEAGKLGNHPDVYGRMAWDRPAPTIKRECAHAGNGRYSHPEQDRLVTLREMGLLNGFPSDYHFAAGSLANGYRHVGDAVPPLIAFQIAHACHWTLTGQRPDLRECILPGTSLQADDLVADDTRQTLF